MLPRESINLYGKLFHKKCAKCSDCGQRLTLFNTWPSDDVDLTIEADKLLCKMHYLKKFDDNYFLGHEKYKNEIKKLHQTYEQLQSNEKVLLIYYDSNRKFSVVLLRLHVFLIPCT